MKLFNKISLLLLLSFLGNLGVFGDTDIIRVKENWVYVPDSNGNFYWQDLNDMGEIPPYNELEDVQFWLYTRRNINDGQIITLRDNASIEESHYDRNNPTRVIIQGWLTNINTSYCIDARKAYLDVGEFNVIVVDWGKISENPIYPIPAFRTKDVAKTVASFLNFFYENGYLESFDNVTIVGHSLGAQISGMTGKNTLKKVAVIYGLDPASVLFSPDRPEHRLDKDDAQLTVTLRTNAGPIGMGYAYPMAHMDFLPNGGMIQPGCNLYTISSCSHIRAFALFTESIGSANFVAIGCTDFDEAKHEQCTPTGTTAIFVAENITNQPGYYYFKTDLMSPYGLGAEGEPRENGFDFRAKLKPMRKN